MMWLPPPGVSITTVSRVLNKVPTVSEANRSKVEEVIRQLRFVPSPYAQALARGSVSNTVAFIIPVMKAYSILFTPWSLSGGGHSL